ncbi:MAG TPA: RidA family protein [Pseudorhodoplanes sp.]|nr:RidA family protein [Pseudorhodoplanes sp.]
MPIALEEMSMITRFPGLAPTRSRAVVYDRLVFTVAVTPGNEPDMYAQTASALRRIDESLAMCGSDKSRILQATVYISDMARKSEMDRAWSEWVDLDNPPQRACLGVTLEPPHLVEIVIVAAR